MVKSVANVTGQQKTDFLLKSATLKITNAYQVTYISLSDAPDTAEEYVRFLLGSFSRTDQEDLANKPKQKAQKVSFF